MTEENVSKIIEVMINAPLFKWTLGTIVTTLVGWAMVSIRNTNKKIRNAVSTQDLEDSKSEMRRYTDEKIEIHEDKQVLELLSLSKNVSDTHEMVTKLLDLQLNSRL